MKHDVKISSLRPDGAIKAYASVNLNDDQRDVGSNIAFKFYDNLNEAPAKRNAVKLAQLAHEMTSM